jgi:hypothetical protein
MYDPTATAAVMFQTASTAEFVNKVNRYFKVIKKLSQDMQHVSRCVTFAVSYIF